MSSDLVFDNEKENHTAHVSAVLEVLSAKNTKVDINYCAIDKPS